MKKVERNNYVQYKDAKTVYVDGVEVNLEKYISKLENSILKGECASFENDAMGYKYKLLMSNYELKEYKVDLNDDADNSFNFEMNRLCKLANSETMMKRFKRKWKDIHTKSKYIFYRNLRESANTPVGRFGILLPSGWIFATSVVSIIAVLIGAYVGNPFMHLPAVFSSALAADIIIMVPLLASGLFVLGRTIVKSVKEISDRKYKKYEEKEIIKNRSQVKEKELEKEQVKEVTRSKSVSKNYVPTQSIEESRTIAYLKEKYNMLAKERNRLIGSNGSISEIQDITNQMKAILYRYNTIINPDGKTNTYGGPVPKLRKNRVLEF